MINILQNQIDHLQIDTANPAFLEFILAIQQDTVDRSSLYQSDLNNIDILGVPTGVFPETPSLGGIFNTRWGGYEAIYLPPVPPDKAVGQWRRLSDNSIHAVGAAIPTTL